MLSDAEHLILTDLNVACSAVSFVGCIFVICCYFYYKEARNFAFHLVFMLTISDAGSAIGYFLHDPPETSPLCYIQSLVTSFFGVASILCTFVISVLPHFVRRDFLDCVDLVFNCREASVGCRASKTSISSCLLGRVVASHLSTARDEQLRRKRLLVWSSIPFIPSFICLSTFCSLCRFPKP